MAFLGFVVTPATPLSYPVFNAAASAVGTAGAVAAAAKATAIGGLLALGSIALGAGAGGFLLGKRIMEGLEYTGPEPTVGQTYKIPAGVGRIRVFARAKIAGRPLENFENVFDSPVTMPVSRRVGVVQTQGALVGPNQVFVPYIQAADDLIEIPLEVVSVARENGQPLPEALKIPGYVPQFPLQPYKLPTAIPIAPGIPDFPITPELVPNPDNDPEENDDKAKTPGLIVKIPELGQQFIFTPGGVIQQRYRGPDTEPYEQPKIPPPPNFKPPSTQECPCPSEEGKDEEILCRIKSLQDEILDDGFLTQIRSFGGAQCFEVLNLGEGFYQVELSATVIPANAKRISYPGPGVDTVFVGNVQFLLDGVPTEPIPIRGIRQMVRAPENCTGYVVSGAFGFQLTSLAYNRTKKPYIDNC